MIRTILLTLLIFVTSCERYQVHPGSINKFDSVTADMLTGVRVMLDKSRPQLQSGALPASLRPAFTSLAKAYDVAVASYKSWRDLAAKNQDATAQLNQLQKDLATLTQSLTAYTKAGGK